MWAELAYLPNHHASSLLATMSETSAPAVFVNVDIVDALDARICDRRGWQFVADFRIV